MTTDFAQRRNNMVESQVRPNDVTNLAIQDAMRLAPRELLAPAGRADLAYAEAPLAYAPGYSLAEARDVSKLLQAVRPVAGERALAIAAPYAAMVMARMGLTVVARQPEGPAAQAVAQALTAEGVTLEAGDLAQTGQGGPYDVIVCEGAVPHAPPAWGAALAVNGRLGVFERNGPVGKAQLYLRAEAGGLARRELFDATPHLLPGFAAAPAFSF